MTLEVCPWGFQKHKPAPVSLPAACPFLSATWDPVSETNSKNEQWGRGQWIVLIIIWQDLELPRRKASGPICEELARLRLVWDGLFYQVDCRLIGVGRIILTHRTNPCWGILDYKMDSELLSTSWCGSNVTSCFKLLTPRLPRPDYTLDWEAKVNSSTLRLLPSREELRLRVKRAEEKLQALVTSISYSGHSENLGQHC